MKMRMAESTLPYFLRVNDSSLYIPKHLFDPKLAMLGMDCSEREVAVLQLEMKWLEMYRFIV